MTHVWIPYPPFNYYMLSQG